jgi:beta-lactamase class A
MTLASSMTKHRFQHLSLLATILISCLTLFNSVATVSAARISGPAPSPSASGRSRSQESDSTPESEPNPELSKAIDTLLEGESGIWGVIVQKPGEGFTYHKNADTPFITASLYKLILMADIYQKRENGELSFDDTVELQPDYFPGPDEFDDSYYLSDSIGESPTIDELMFAAGAYSSNVAAQALLSLTDTGSIDTTTIDLGLNDTYLLISLPTLPSWPPTPTPDGSSDDIARAIDFVNAQAVDGWVNITTPRDMAHFFDLLYHKQIVSEEASTEMMTILGEQAVDDRFPVLLPYPTDMAHKTGNLDHVVHDVGIIWAPDGPVILIAMAEDDEDDARATAIIQRLALIAYGDYDVPSIDEQPSGDDAGTAEAGSEEDDGSGDADTSADNSGE